MKTSNNVVLITGGSSGIGLAIAKKFLEHNNTVIVTGLSQEKLQQVKSELPEINIMRSDVTSEADIKALAEHIQTQFGGVDILMNNAGIMKLMDAGAEGSDLTAQLTEIDINFSSPVRMLHYFLPQLKVSQNPVLVNTSSGLAYVPYAQAPVYSGTKAAMHFWSMAIRPQLALHGIKVVELLPPVVDTKLAKEADLSDDILKPMPTEKLADIFWNDFIRGKVEITPGVSKLLKLSQRLAPKLAFSQLNKKPVPEATKA